ncbi:NHL repeat-containing protein [Nocardia sp. IFM 10818]
MKSVLLTAVLITASVFGAGIATALPIPSLPGAETEFLGEPARPRPIPDVPAVPQHPGLAANGNAGIHNDGWMTDTYTRPGPLGIDTRVDSLLLGSECGSIAFDRAGRIVATCPGLNPGLYLIDPAQLRVLGKYPLPGRGAGEFLRPGAFTNFGGGAYFSLDNRDRAVVGASNGHVLVLAENPAADGFTLERDYDLTGALREGETLNSVLPDADGLLWFVAKTNGVVGTIDPETGAVRVIRLGNGADGQIQNSFAVGAEGDVYIATNRELLRFDAGPDGAPDITWRVTYANSGQRKPGQVDDGTGTTPTLLPGGYVAITDNADPMNVVVYRTAPAAQREVCSVPVFSKGASSTENSLIGAGNSLIVENNYGYTGPEATMGGGTTTPGFARVDIEPGGAGCRLVWTSTTVAAPSVVPKLSLATGLIYTYAKGAEITDPWYWTALDFHTGNLVWQRHSGSGPLFNNNYAGLALGPDGAAYLGTLGGLITVRDGGPS